MSMFPCLHQFTLYTVLLLQKLEEELLWPEMLSSRLLISRYALIENLLKSG